MSFMTYSEMHDEPEGQATCMDAGGGKDASILKDGEASGEVFASIFAARRENQHAAFLTDAVNRQKVPRTARSG